MVFGEHARSIEERRTDARQGRTPVVRALGARRSAIEGAENAEGATVDDMGVEHRGSHVFVSEELASRGTGGSRRLAAGIRGYAAAAYLRRSADRLRKATAYPREYGDMSPGGVGHRQENEDRLAQLAAYMPKYRDRLCVTDDCDVRLDCVASLANSPQVSGAAPIASTRVCGLRQDITSFQERRGQ
jgi:hypothetical protein